MYTWLYVNGRPTYWVLETWNPLYPPPAVNCSLAPGMVFYWNGSYYNATTVTPVPIPYYHNQVFPQAQAIHAPIRANPDPTAPPILLPTTVTQMRQYLLDGLTRLLSHSWLLGLSDTDKAILQAEYRLYSTDDIAVGKVLAAIQVSSPSKGVVMSTSNAAIDWQAVLAKLEALVIKVPALLPVLSDFIAKIEEILASNSGKMATIKATASCTPDCCHMCCEHLDCAVKGMLDALAKVLCVKHCLCECCPDNNVPPLPGND